MQYDYFKRFAPIQNEISISKDKTAVIYTRVSSKEQLSNDSLDTQYKECTSFAIKNGFKVVKYFGGVYESAKSDDDRKEFRAMLDFVTSKKNKIGAIICFNYDRFSRTGIQAIEIISLLQRNSIKVYSAINTFDPESIEGKVMLTMTLLQANIANVNKSIDTKRKMREKIQNGYWVHKCPRGYARDSKKIIHINREGEHIREGFQMLLKGFTPIEIQRYLYVKGLRINTKRWSEIFRNPFYCGIMISNSYDYIPIEGKHPKIVSLLEFKRAMEILDTDGKPRNGNLIINTGLPLKGNIKCASCGSKFTGYLNKKKQKYYYICNNQDCRINVSAVKANKEFYEYLKNIVPISLPSSLLTQRLKELLVELNSINSADIEKCQIKVDALKSKMSQLADMLLSGMISNDLFKQKLHEFENQKEQIESKLEKLQMNVSNPEEVAAICIQYVRKTPFLWLNEGISVKRRVQQTTFTGHIFYDKENACYRTNGINSVFHVINTITASYNNKKADLSLSFVNKSAGVPRAGVEPAHP
ncbi:recombinase family protein [Sabulibacter ruber]|uniref:recombinase family protein n=1 Tax=Sabulibacter ruber TaxID=2811901 RepID=UPI001A95C3D8|nr:recombinase family protein [Sabulibacter ruber]